MDYDDEAPAKGWNLLKWKWAREPNETFVAAVYVALFLVMATLFAVGVGGLVKFLAPIWSEKATGDAEPGALRDRLIAIGALLTTPFLVWRLVVSHWAARASQEQARIAQETSRNTLFTKAVEQLGAMREERLKEETRDAGGAVTGSKETIRIRPNTEVRLGAIYALEKLAREDLNMHWPIMETLCANVRENAGPAKAPERAFVDLLLKGWEERSETENSALNVWRDNVKPPAVDIQAAITVIGRRSPMQKKYEQRLRKAGESDAWRLDFRGAHLACVNLVGMGLAEARFDDCALHFGDARRADLQGASFLGAHLESAELEGIHLEQARLGWAKLQLARLQNAHLEGAHLEFALLDRVELRSANFEGAWLEGARFEGSRVEGANFTDAFLNGAHLEGAVNLDQKQPAILNPSPSA